MICWAWFYVEYLFTPSAYGIQSHLQPPLPNSHLIWFSAFRIFWGLEPALTFLFSPDSSFSSLRFTFSSWNLHKPVSPAFLQLSFYTHYLGLILSLRLLSNIPQWTPGLWQNNIKRHIYVLIMLIYLPIAHFLLWLCLGVLKTDLKFYLMNSANESRSGFFLKRN